MRCFDLMANLLKEMKLNHLFSSNKEHEIRTILFLFIILCISAAISVRLGTYPISSFDLVKELINPGSADIATTVVVWEIRIPRIILAALVGASLAVAGCVYQGIFRNPLVEPYLLGVSSGAAFGAALAIVIGFNIVSLQITALIFALISVCFVYFLATKNGRTPMDCFLQEFHF